MTRFKEINDQTRTAFKSLRELTAREREFMLKEVLQVAGLMPLLMKRRNKQQWSPEDKAQLGEYLKRLSHISPYLAVLVLPGGLLMLPALAWWLDRRRNRAPALPRSASAPWANAAPRDRSADRMSLHRHPPDH